MMRAQDLPPGFEPDPALSAIPDTWDKRQSRNWNGERWTEWYGEGPVRWCACRTFAVYRGPGRFGRIIKGGETVSLELLRPHCDWVTRKVFAADHPQWIMDLLAQSGGFGYKAVLLPDTEPMDVWDAAAKFGLSIGPHYRAKRERTAASVAKRAERYAALRQKNKSDAVVLADDVARLI